MGNKRFLFRGFKRPDDNRAWHKASGEMIYKWRQRRGLSQQALADRTSATRGQISKYELGNASPKAEHIIEIAQALQITIHDLQPQLVTTYPLTPDESYNLLLRRTEAAIAELREIQRLARAVYTSPKFSHHREVKDPQDPSLQTVEEIARQRHLEKEEE